MASLRISLICLLEPLRYPLMNSLRYHLRDTTKDTVYHNNKVESMEGVCKSHLITGSLLPRW